MDILVSVIVPIYNVEQYLKRCVDSIINQTYKNLEIILVDDGSPDNCPEICDNYAKIDGRIKIIHKANGGLSDARNAGIKIATGEYISFIDSDDWIDLSMYENMIATVIEEKVDIVSCGVKWVEEDGTVIRNDTTNSKISLSKNEAMRELLLDGLLKQHVWNKLYKADLIKNVPFAKGKYHEDVYWSYQVFGVADKVSIITEPYYNYVQRRTSIMGEKYSAKRLDALDAMQQRCDYMKKYFSDLYDLSLYVYMGSCMFHMQNAIKTNCEKEIINDIKSRLSYKNSGNVYTCINGKQAIWMRLFFLFPELICKVRNRLGVGV